MTQRDVPRYPQHGATGHCHVHNKLLFSDRKKAKQKVRELSRKGDRMREYPCDAVDGMWHVGHLPDVVKRGRKTAGECYG